MTGCAPARGVRIVFGDTVTGLPLMRTAGKELALDRVAVCIGARADCGLLAAPAHFAPALPSAPR